MKREKFSQRGRILALLGYILICMLLLSSCLTARTPFDEDVWRDRVNSADPSLLYAPHFKDGRYYNPWMPMEEKGFISLLRWKLSPGAPYTEEERTYRAKVRPNVKERILRFGSDDFILWIGHATFLIRVNGEYWLTDPIFSERALIPRRIAPPAISLEELREITSHVNIVISHNHHDHLDSDSIKGLPDGARIYVPMGLKAYAEGYEKGHVEEMDWWQAKDLGNGVKLVCLPAQHWSRRVGQGYNESLWASFMIITPNVTIYYGGDSGYFIGYKEIGRKFPGIDYALLPTTAFHPRWFMHYAHMDTRETIQAFSDLKARYMVPTQWGTFNLGDEPAGYPLLDLKREIKVLNLDPSQYLFMDIGEILPIGRKGRPR